MKELPDYYVIKRDLSNPLWEKYIDWLNEKYNTEWGGNCNYYGYTGNSTDSIYSENGTEYQKEISMFRNSPTLITLEQWDEAVNPFVLPEKWCVKRTPENAKIINDWANGKYGQEKQFTADGFVGSNFCRVSLSEGYTEITFDQFKKHVLKENDMSKEEVKVGDWVWSNTPNCEREYLRKTNDGFVGKIIEIKNSGYNFRISVNAKQYPEYSSSTIESGYGYVWCDKCRKADLEEIEEQQNLEPMKDRTITAQQAQSIIDVACETWQEKLAKIWGDKICRKKDVEISLSFYTEMRSVCNPEQHKRFDSIFGKDKKEVCITSLKTGEWLRTENGNTYLKVGDKVFCKDNDKLHDMHTITGKKVRIKNIEFTEVE